LIALRSSSLVLLNLSGCSLGVKGAKLIANALERRSDVYAVVLTVHYTHCTQYSLYTIGRVAQQ
jgi:hypothetical protein